MIGLLLPKGKRGGGGGGRKERGGKLYQRIEGGLMLNDSLSIQISPVIIY